MANINDPNDPNNPNNQLVNPNLPTPNRQGSGFTNLQRIIGANKNNQLGSAIQTGVGNTVGQFQAGLGTAQNDFNAKLKENSLTGADSVNPYGTGYQAPTAGTDAARVNSVLTDPSKATDDDYSAFDKYRSGAYNGPSTLDNSGLLQSQAGEIQNLGQNRDQLLQKYAGGSRYTQGQRQLDNLILSQTDPNALKNVRASTQGLSDQTNSLIRTDSDQASGAAQGNKLFAQNLNHRFGVADDPATAGVDESKVGEFGQLRTTLQGQLDNKNTANHTNFNDFENRLSGSNLGANDIKYIDQVAPITANSNLFDQSPELLGQQFEQGNYNMTQAANQQQGASYNALKRLAGQTGPIIIDPTNSNQEFNADPTQLGQNIDAVQLQGYKNPADAAERAANYKNALTGQNTNYYSQVDPLQANSDAISGANKDKIISDLYKVQQTMYNRTNPDNGGFKDPDVQPSNQGWGQLNGNNSTGDINRASPEMRAFLAAHPEATQSSQLGRFMDTANGSNVINPDWDYQVGNDLDHAALNYNNQIQGVKDQTHFGNSLRSLFNPQDQAAYDAYLKSKKT